MIYKWVSHFVQVNLPNQKTISKKTVQCYLLHLSQKTVNVVSGWGRIKIFKVFINLASYEGSDNLMESPDLTVWTRNPFHYPRDTIVKLSTTELSISFIRIPQLSNLSLPTYCNFIIALTPFFYENELLQLCWYPLIHQRTSNQTYPSCRERLAISFSSALKGPNPSPRL